MPLSQKNSGGDTVKVEVRACSCLLSCSRTGPCTSCLGSDSSSSPGNANDSRLRLGAGVQILSPTNFESPSWESGRVLHRRLESAAQTRAPFGCPSTTTAKKQCGKSSRKNENPIFLAPVTRSSRWSNPKLLRRLFDVDTGVHDYLIDVVAIGLSFRNPSNLSPTQD
jgi:hypothetical protein